MAFYSLFIPKRAVPQNSTRNSSVLWHFILYSSQKGQFPRTPPETVQFCGILFFIHPKKGSSPELHQKQFSSVAFYSLFIQKRAVPQRQHLVRGGPVRAGGGRGSVTTSHSWAAADSHVLFVMFTPCCRMSWSCLNIVVCWWGWGGGVGHA